LDHRRFFLENYQRTTGAVGKAIDDARFEDSEWVERGDVVFADLSWRLTARHRAPRGRCTTAVAAGVRRMNRLSSRHFLREARQKVWHNVGELQQARLQSSDRYATRPAELEVLSAARIADLLAPGQVLLRLAVAGF
jgi:hypothetical protein